MISRIAGVLRDVGHDSVEVEVAAGLHVEVLLPTFALTRLADQTGRPVTLYTLAFLESHNQGASFIPRLAGFLTPADREFFELFVTTKGIGNRKALRALAMPAAQIAAAIADRDTRTLQTLPEIGKRTAETIVVTLKDKVDRFVAQATYPPRKGGADAGAGSGGGSVASGGGGSGGGLAREALEVLLQLGESRADAVMWIDRLLSQDDPPGDTQALVAEVYRLKAGA